MQTMHLQLLRETCTGGAESRVRMTAHWEQWRDARCALDEELARAAVPLAALAPQPGVLAAGPDVFLASCAADRAHRVPAAAWTRARGVSPGRAVLFSGLPSGEGEGQLPRRQATSWASGSTQRHLKQHWEAATGERGRARPSSQHRALRHRMATGTDGELALREMQAWARAIQPALPGLLGQCALATAAAADTVRLMHGFQERDADCVHGFRLGCMHPGGVLSLEQQQQVLMGQLCHGAAAADTALLCREAGRLRQHGELYAGVRGMML